jgi:hypothetical protein
MAGLEMWPYSSAKKRIIYVKILVASDFIFQWFAHMADEARMRCTVNLKVISGLSET